MEQNKFANFQNKGPIKIFDLYFMAVQTVFILAYHLFQSKGSVFCSPNVILEIFFIVRNISEFLSLYKLPINHYKKKHRH